MRHKIRLVILTKEPASADRAESINSIDRLDAYDIVGVLIEDSMHLPLHKFFWRTLKRIKKGYIYLPEFISSIVAFTFTKTPNSASFETRIKNKKIPIYRVKNIQTKDSIKMIKKMKPDLGIIIGHRIIPETVYTIPKNGMINVHHGILPRYAGSHSTFWSLVENQKEVGVTVHKVSKHVDIGDILHIKSTRINHHNSVKLYEEVKKIAPLATVEALKGLADGKMKYRKQNISIRKNWRPPTFWERRKYKKYLSE